MLVATVKHDARAPIVHNLDHNADAMLWVLHASIHRDERCFDAIGRVRLSQCMDCTLGCALGFLSKGQGSLLDRDSAQRVELRLDFVALRLHFGKNLLLPGGLLLLFQGVRPIEDNLRLVTEQIQAVVHQLLLREPFPLPASRVEQGEEGAQHHDEERHADECEDLDDGVVSVGSHADWLCVGAVARRVEPVERFEVVVAQTRTGVVVVERQHHGEVAVLARPWLVITVALLGPVRFLEVRVAHRGRAVRVLTHAAVPQIVHAHRHWAWW